MQLKLNIRPVLENPWAQAAAVLLGALLAAGLIYLLSPILVPLFFAFLVAYVLDPVVDVFEKRGISRMVTIGAVAALTIAAVLAVPLFLIPGAIDQAQSLGERAETVLQGGTESGLIGGLTHGLLSALPLEALVEGLGLVDPESPDYDPDYDPVAVLTLYFSKSIQEQGAAFLQSHAGELAGFGQTAGGGVASILGTIGGAIMRFVLFIANFALFGFVAVYLLRDFDGIVVAARELVPNEQRIGIERIVGKINEQLRGFLRGQAMVCVCLGTFYAIGLSIAGVPFAVLIGLFGAIVSFVPYLGIVLTMIPAILLCLLQYQGIDWHLLVVLGTFGAAQLLEGTVITPKLVGDQVGLGPVWVILAVLVFGNALGFLGLLLAVPIAATLKVVVLEGLDVYYASDVFRGSPPESG